MPGIVGVVEAQAPERLEARVQSMLAAMRHRPRYAVDTRVGAGCALGKLSVHPEQAFAEDGACVLAYWGDIHALPGGTARDASLGKRLLDLYRQSGPRALAGLNGIYTVAVWDASERRLTLVNDRYGFKKLYYYTAGDLFLFASEYKSFVGQPGFNAALGEEGIVELLEVGYPLDDDTLFRDVKLVPPASVLTLCDGRMGIETYWDYVFANREGRSEEEIADEYDGHLRNAIVRQARDGMCIQASGGLDSRALMGAVAKHCPGLDVRAATVGDSWTHDVKFGRKMARTFGYPHTVVPVPKDFYERYLADGVDRTEGAVSSINFFVLTMDDYLVRSGATAVMNGFLGGCLSGAHLFPELAEMTDPAQTCDWLTRKFYRALFRDDQRKRLFRPEIARHVQDLVPRKIRACFDRRPDLDLLDRSDYVDLQQRQRRFQASHVEFWSPVCAVLDPFADNEVLDFLLGIPARTRMKRRFYVEMIRRHLPKAAKIPRTGSGIPLTVSPLQEKLIRARMRFYYHILPRLTFGRLGRGNFAANFQSNDRLRKVSRGFVTQLLGRRELLEDVLNMDEVTRILQEYLDGEDWNAGQVTMLLTLAEWRRQYTGVSRADVVPVGSI